MGFKLNIGKDGGGGSTGFSLSQSLNMIKAKGMSSQMVGTDVMKDGYYNTVNESGAGSPNNFNAGFRALPESVQEDIKDGMPMNDDGPYMTTAMYQKSCFNVNDPDKDPAEVDSSNELLRDKDKKIIPDDAKVTKVDVNLGRGGKTKAKQTKRTIRRAAGDDKPNSARYGTGRIGTETTTEFGDSNKKIKTKLSGTEGFVKSGPKKGMVIEGSVNSVTPRGVNTSSSKPKASMDGLSARARKDEEKDGPTMMYGKKK